MKNIKIYFEDGDYSYSGFNGTEKEIAEYYVGKIFNVGRGEHDYCVKCVGVTFLD